MLVLYLEQVQILQNPSFFLSMGKTTHIVTGAIERLNRALHYYLSQIHGNSQVEYRTRDTRPSPPFKIKGMFRETKFVA
jgi:hypothetical protein